MNKFFLIYFAFFIQVYSQIKINPIRLIQGKYPIVLSTSNEDNYYYLISDIENLKIEKESGSIKETIDDIHTTPNSIYFSDIRNNNYIITESYECILINYNDFSRSEAININSLLDLDKNIIKQMGSIPQNDDFILYGYYKNEIFFSSKSQQYNYRYETEYQFDDNNNKLSCKFIDSEIFICAMIVENKVILKLLNYHIDSENLKLNLLALHSTLYIDNGEFSDVALYDTPKENIKLICLKKLENINCRFYHLLNLEEKDNIIYNIIGYENIIVYISYDFSDTNCQFSEFNDEFLFCCAQIDLIICFRIDQESYKLISYYKLEMPGGNSHLTIKNNNHFITLFYMNEYENDVGIYEYYIYLPISKNRIYIIYNFELENYIGKLSDLFKVQTNNYYFELINPPDNYGYFSLNDTKINGKKPIPNNDYILYFIVKNKDITNKINFCVNYSISFLDNQYTKECQIDITLMPCYHTCYTCSEDISASNENQHNCIKCKDNYYPFPINNANCYTIEEKEINWYLDINNYEFVLSNEKCKSCSGPSESECTSCNSGLYLENGRCNNNCAEGYFPLILDENDFYTCYECYDNCKTCSKQGEASDTGCIECKDNHIKYNSNCYKIKDETGKTFCDQENNNIESSCYQKFSLYIKEDSYECIELPESEEGYYISNTEMGILSKCHENCLSCNYGPKYNEQGILESMECLECKYSQSGRINIIRADNNCFKILNYNQTHILFNISEIIPKIQ